MPTYKVHSLPAALKHRRTLILRGYTWRDCPPASPQASVPLEGQIFPMGDSVIFGANYVIAPDTETPPPPPPPPPGGNLDYYNAVITEAPRLYARLGDVGAVSSDASGSGITGQIVGAPTPAPGLVAPDANGALAFDAPGEYVSYGRVPSVELQRFTLICMMRVGVAPVSIPLIRYDSTDSNLWGRGYSLYINGAGQLAFKVGFGTGGYFEVSSGVSLLANTKYHLAATFDGQTLSGYINGAAATGLVFFPQPKTVSYSSPSGLYLMKDPNGSGADFNNSRAVTLDEVSIHSGALPAGAIANLSAKGLA